MCIECVCVVELFASANQWNYIDELYDFRHRIHIFDVCLRVSDSISIQFKQNFKWFFVIADATVAAVDAFDMIKYERCASTTWQTETSENTQKSRLEWQSERERESKK